MFRILLSENMKKMVLENIEDFAKIDGRTVAIEVSFTTFGSAKALTNETIAYGVHVTKKQP